MKKISIIIPVLNEARALRTNLPLLQCVRSLGHELIVVDGGAARADNAEFTELVDRWQYSAPGRATQMNAGAQLASGEVLMFLHIDTQLPSDGVDIVAQACARPSVLWGRFDVRLSGGAPALRVIEYMINLRSRLSGVATGDQTLFVRRSVFRQIGGFPEIPLMEDVAISKRLRAMAAPLCLRAKVNTSSRRWEAHGVLRTVVLMWKIRWLYFLGVAPEKLHVMYMTKTK